MTKKILLLLIVLLATSLLVLPYENVNAQTIQGNVVFTMNNPPNDDKGPGSYTYPKASVFKPGVFDLRKFTVINSTTSVIFNITFANLGGNPWGGPNGFSLQHIQIYIHMSDSVPGRTDTFGANVIIRGVDSWHMAFIITPGWGTTWPSGGGNMPPAIVYSNNTIKINPTGYVITANNVTNTITAQVDKTLFPPDYLSNMAKWRYVVLVMSYDGFGPYGIRTVSTEAGDWTLGGADPLAVLAGVQPYVIDMLASNSTAQFSMLSSYNAKSGTLATVAAVPYKSGISLPGPLAPLTTTVTITSTTTRITTSTYTTTIPTTTTLISTSTYTTVQEVIGTVTYGLAVLAIIFLLALIYVLLKKK